MNPAALVPDMHLAALVPDMHPAALVPDMHPAALVPDMNPAALVPDMHALQAANCKTSSAEQCKQLVISDCCVVQGNMSFTRHLAVSGRYHSGTGDRLAAGAEV